MQPRETNRVLGSEPVIFITVSKRQNRPTCSYQITVTEHSKYGYFSIILPQRVIPL